MVDWSWNLLDPAEQAAMRALSVFPGGFTAEAAQALVGDDALGVLEHLVDQSLLRASDDRGRYPVPDARDGAGVQPARRTAAGRTEAVTDAFLAWARDLGLRVPRVPVRRRPVLHCGHDLRAEQDNLVQAVRQALDRRRRRDRRGRGRRCCSSLWTIESNFTRMAQLADETAYLLSHYRPEPDLVEATRTTLALSATYALLCRVRARCARWSRCAGCRRPRRPP